MSRTTYRDRINERLRLMQVYDVFVRYGSDGAFDRGLPGDLRRWMQSRLYGVELRPLTQPEKVRLMLQELGPTYVKLGQLISSRADALPAEWEHELAKLQSDVKPFPVQEAREVIAEELGAPVEELFESFSPKPLAAASLGQVHRATLPGGRPVVVKVQRPNIEARVQADLRILAGAAALVERRAALAREVGLRGIIDEFGAALLLELDYRLEAYNARRLARALEGLEGVRVPEMIRDRCARRVLTMEYIDGVPANDRDAIIAAGLDPTRVADNAVRAALKMVLVDGFFHADPHPGNVMVGLDDGVITFIDTGMVGELNVKRRVNLVMLLYTMTKGDPLSLAQSLRSLSEPFRGRTDPKAFDESFTRRIGPLMDVPEGEKLEVAAVTSLSLDLLRDAGYRPDPQLSLAMKAMTQAEQFMKVLYPPGSSKDFTGKAIAMTTDLAAEHFTEERITEFARKQAGYAAREVVQNLPSLQEATNMWLRQYRAGRFEVKVDTSDLEPQVRSIAGISRMLTAALLVVGVLVGSAIAANAPERGTFESLRQVALVGYAVALAIAAVMLIVLVRRAMRGDRDDEDRR